MPPERPNGRYRLPRIRRRTWFRAGHRAISDQPRPRVRAPRTPTARWLRNGLITLALTSGLVTAAIALFVAREAWPALVELAPSAWLDREGWHPASDHFDLTAMAAASALVSLGALTIAVPSGLGVAMLCHVHAADRLGEALNRLLTVLAGLPSVVYGLWGLTTLVPWIAAIQAPGPSLLAASLVLGLMIVPTFGLLSVGILEQVACSHRSAAAALGLGPWTVLGRITLPAARHGLGAALLLAAGRAIGETMAVLMVAGNVVALPHSVFDPVRTLTANIALEMGYALGRHRAALFASALVLLSLTAAVVAIARRLRPTGAGGANAQGVTPPRRRGHVRGATRRGALS